MKLKKPLATHARDVYFFYSLTPQPRQVSVEQVLQQGRYSEEEEVLEVFNLWLGTLNRHDAQAVCSLYDPEAVLLATLTPLPCDTPELISDYFESLVARPALRCELHDYTVRVEDDMALVTGLYTFSFTENGTPVSLPARFSFTYSLSGNRWLIACHHSSRVES